VTELRGVLRFYRLLLRLYPAQFRQDYEREILATFRREWGAQQGMFGAAFFLGEACGAVVIGAFDEHLDMLANDLRYALRSFARTPGFTALAIATLALGMGVNSALFSVVKSVLFADLPFAKPDELVRVWIRNPKQGFEHDISNLPRLEDWRHAHSFEGLAGFTASRLILTGASEPVELRGASVTPNFFRVMGVRLLLGHDFEEGDDREGAPRKVVLSHGLWLRQFAGDPSVVGTHLTLSGETYEVAAVAPPRVRFPGRDLDFWSPLVVDDRTRQSRRGFWLNVAGRLRGGVSRSQAEGEMNALSRSLAREHVEDRDLDGVALVSLNEDLTGSIRPALAVLTGAVFFILLICCANIAGMLSARGVGRIHELSIRTALGAGRSRVVRQLLTESLVLFTVGGAVGLAVGYLGVGVLLRLAPSELPQLQDTRLDPAVAAWTLAVSVACGLVFGLLPSLQSSQIDVTRGMRRGARGLAGRSGGRRFRSALTIGEMALAMILLTGSWLLVRSFARIERVPLGYDPRSISIAQIQLPRRKYPDGPQSIDFYLRLVDALDSTPGISAAGAITNFFLDQLPDSSPFFIEGREEKVATPITTDVVTPDFFSTMRIPLLRGRFFDAHDRAGSLLVIIINHATAVRYWPGEDPIGKRITFGDPGNMDALWYTIVGVVGDTSRAGPDHAVLTESYGPIAQGASRSMAILIRGSGARSALQAAVRSLDPDQPVARFGSLDAAVGEQVASRRFTTFLLTLFALTALAVTGVGLYGLISYLVTQRRQEFGVRMALGARAGDVLGIVVSRVGLMAGVGIGLGGLGALGVSRLLEALLFGVTRFDPGSYLGAAALLVGVAMIAAVSPAIRAVRTEPAVALRTE
jgi:putative ABC transport system permease protein